MEKKIIFFHGENLVAEVTGCKDCPMNHESTSIGTLCALEGYNTLILDSQITSTPITPDWCPISKNGIFITLKK